MEITITIVTLLFPALKYALDVILFIICIIIIVGQIQTNQIQIMAITLRVLFLDFIFLQNKFEAVTDGSSIFLYERSNENSPKNQIFPKTNPKNMHEPSNGLAKAELQNISKQQLLIE